jgi:hypothetical protein
MSDIEVMAAPALTPWLVRGDRDLIEATAVGGLAR